ncbi:branched-chain amino acid ABC transporter permease [Albidovulum sp.]|uniref:branched-chain amino acid ABC transporter permease n=1 Tax=Albidovulum sp. TaxID=1872424 RepID=UPI001D70FD40|nr:branched-chain amino acid ABC transporter permease [Paracoccaceae bacterium]MCC0045138.1 branched-chain amino acid ABC transporter permease [Defluviimonas sp.]HPE25671.1 branched-chain amino acid ABC transporter permease [Albidovulum sp.]MCB2121353.1 branched-chain amino acid ABC transporter permease [Paracoccaceae bacterium]MCB2131565.1 branched-chain amino acid ABC transporter permease [Paracoccaceae bacterium]
MSFGPFLLLALMEGMVTSAVLALAAVGLSLVFGIMRVVNVAHGEFFMLGAVSAWFVSQWVPGPPAVAFAAALILCPLFVGAIAALADMVVLKRLNYEPEATIVATIGLLYILQQAALSFYGPDARPVPAPFNFRVQLPWFGYSGYKIAVVAASALVLLGVWRLLAKSRVGLIMRATQYDRETARAFGINVDRVYAGVFALGGGLAALAAVLIVPIQQAHYLMGTDPLLLSFIVVIIGGLGSLRGTVIAALLIGLSDGVISTFFAPTLAKIVATLLVALVLVFRPQGLFGRRAL